MSKTLIHVDFRSNTKAFVKVLSNILDLNLIQVRCGEEALRKAKSENARLILSELELPGINAVELFTQLRTNQCLDAKTILFTHRAPALPEFANKLWGIDLVCSTKDYQPIIDACLSVFNLSPTVKQQNILHAISNIQLDLEPLLVKLRDIQLPEHWIIPLVEFINQAKSFSEGHALTQQLSTSDFPCKVRVAALKLLIHQKVVKLSFYENLLSDKDTPEQMLKSALPAFAEAASKPDALAMVLGFLEHSSLWLRHISARSLLGLAKRLSKKGADSLCSLVRASWLPIDIREEAATALLGLGHAPPEIVFADNRASHALRQILDHKTKKMKQLSEILSNENNAPSVRSSALSQLGELVDLTRYRASCMRYIRSPEPQLASTAYISLMKATVWNEASMEVLIDDGDIPNTVRIPCLISLGQRGHRHDAQRIIKRILFDHSSELQNMALTAAILAGESQECLLVSAVQDNTLSPNLRLRALRHLSDHSKASLLGLLEPLLKEQDLNLSTTACELMIKTLGNKSGEFIDQQLALLNTDHQHAGLEGALSLEQAGFMILVAIAFHAGISFDVRLRALRNLETRYPVDLTRRFIPRIREQLKDETQALGDTPKPPPLPASGDSSFVITEPQEPAAVITPQADDTIVDDPAAETMASSPSTKPLTQEEPSRNSLGQTDEARQKLAAAFNLGAKGFDLMNEIVCKPSYPEEIRVTALRHMIHTGDSARTQALVEYALSLGTSKMQHAVLAGRLDSSEKLLKALRQTIEDLRNSIDVRLRALKQLQRLTGKEDLTVSICENLFLDPNPELKMAALEMVFPSLRYTQAHKIESSLINLLKDHCSSRVRCSAAHALGAFGGKEALGALEELSSKFLMNLALSRATKKALSQIKTRLTPSLIS